MTDFMISRDSSLKILRFLFFAGTLPKQPKIFWDETVINDCWKDHANSGMLFNSLVSLFNQIKKIIGYNLIDLNNFVIELKTLITQLTIKEFEIKCKFLIFENSLQCLKFL